MRKFFRIKISSLLSIFLFAFLLYVLSVKAAEVNNSQEISSTVQTTLSQNTVSGSARDWSLSAVEWTRYQQLMQGPNGDWYQRLSPAAVLGLNAETDNERQHYAELFAQEQHDKIAREIRFNHEVYLAMHRLYPVEPLIQPFDKTPFNPQKNRGNHP